MHRFLTLTCLALGLTFASCEKDSCTQTWTQLVTVPVTANRQAVQDSIAAMPARELCTGGNLYAFGNYVFVNANREGYHLLDNTNPAEPVNVAFLRVPGATHMAFVDGQMVSDSYADMLVLDFGGPQSLKLLSSTPNLLLQTDGFEVGEDRVAVGFEEQEVTFVEDCSGTVTAGCANCSSAEWFSFDSDGSSFANSVAGNAQVNTGGSLARLAFCDRTLYVLATDRLTTFRLEGLTLRNVRETMIGGGQEALIREGAFLYVASQWGLTILEIGDCGLPISRGSAPRPWGDDPVAVEGDRVIAAIRNGNTPVPGLDGRLMVYDVSDRLNPRVIYTLPLPHPVGVVLRNGQLYVCDGVKGLLRYEFDPANPAKLAEGPVQTLPDADVVDLALLPYTAGTVLLGVGQRTVSQYAVATDGGLTALSSLDATRCVQP